MPFLKFDMCHGDLLEGTWEFSDRGVCHFLSLTCDMGTPHQEPPGRAVSWDPANYCTPGPPMGRRAPIPISEL